MNIKIVNSLNDIKKILDEFNNEFDPSISSLVGDLDKYSVKLFKNAIVLSILDRDNIVGFASFYCNNMETKKAFLSQIAVKKEYRGLKYGDNLLDAVEKICIERKIKFLELEVYNKNTRAINFYEKNGFKFEKKASEESNYLLKTL